MSKPWIRSVPQTSGLIRRAHPFKAVKSIFHESLNADIIFDKQIKFNKKNEREDNNEKYEQKNSEKTFVCLRETHSMIQTHARDARETSQI